MATVETEQVDERVRELEAQVALLTKRLDAHTAYHYRRELEEAEAADARALAGVR